MKYIDIGINLINKQFSSDREEIARKAKEDEIGLIITGTDESSNQAAYDFACSHHNVWCTAGIHPHAAKTISNAFLNRYLTLLDKGKDKIVAVGEIGLDYDRMYSPKDKQCFAFDCMLDIAEIYNLPTFLHERNAVNDFYKILKNHRSVTKRSVVHCFTGTKETAIRYLNLGCMIGITGWICDDRRNKDLLEAIKWIPLERMMIETDAPYLTPKGHDLPRRNVPSNLPYVCNKIAEIKGLDREEVREQFVKNTKKFFGI